MTIEDGVTAYAVSLWGDNGDDPSFRHEGVGTFATSKEALKAAKRAVRVQNANERDDIRWSGLVEEGHREGLNDPEYGYVPNVSWEAHESGERWWLFQTDDGRVEVDPR